MSYHDANHEMREQALELYKSAPETMQAFQSIMKSVKSDGALSAKVKELMAVLVGITSRCEGCILFHLQNAIRHGATRAEVIETICVAVEMGGGPCTIFGGKALAAYDEFAPK